MKAKVKDSRPVLSIGMIVKNEEKKLKRCLDSLQPLMEQVACELIIVDTGSEDSTKDIAREYTDQIYDFEWINDFSAARNYGLDKSKGKWFLFVDADDVLKEPEELIKFLNNKRSAEKYRTGMLIYHSPLDEQESVVSRVWTNRLFLNGKGTRFKGKIHEIPEAYLPMYYFKETFLWHDGYLYETSEEAQQKKDRNNKLLESELEERPNDLRLISHYAATCPHEKRLDLLEHGREILLRKPNDYYMSDIYWRLSRVLVVEQKYEEAITLYEEYQRMTVGFDHVGEIEIALNTGGSYATLEKFDKAAEAYERYIYLYYEYQKGGILENDNMLVNSERISKSFLNSALERCAMCYDYMNKPFEAFEKLIEIDFTATEYINLPDDLTLALACAEKLNRFDLVCRLDDWIREQNTENIDLTPYKNGLIRLLCKAFWTEGQPEKALSDTQELTGELPNLFRLLSPDADWKELNENLQQDREYMRPYQALLLCCALRYHRDPSALLAAVGRESLSDAGNAISIFTPAPELAEMLLSWEPMPVVNEVLFRGWMAELQFRAFANCPEDQKLPLMHRMMEEFSWYVSHLYHPDLLVPDEEKLLALPSPHRFGYWAGLALDEERNGNHLQCVKYLRSAAKTCPEMAEAVKLMVQEVQENDPEYQRKKEQEQLAVKIKEVIEGLILNGNLESARSVLEQYELIAPGDPDIPALKAALIQEPSFTEA